MDDTPHLIKDLAQKFFAFLKEEKNLGALTWLTTIFATVSVALIKFLKFTAESGKLAYWGISPAVIDIAGDNIVYDIIMSAVFSSILMIVFLLPYIIIKSKIRVFYKYICNILIVVSLTVLLFCGSNAKDLISSIGIVGWISFIIADVIFLIMVYAPSFIFFISTKSPKKQPKTITKHTLAIAIIIFLVVNVVYVYFSSYYYTKNQTVFRITDNGYAIIYETDTFYYLAKYDDEHKVIIKETHKVIEKNGVEYTWKNIKE